MQLYLLYYNILLYYIIMQLLQLRNTDDLDMLDFYYIRFMFSLCSIN